MAPLKIYTDQYGNMYVLNELTGEYLIQIPSGYNPSMLSIYVDSAGDVYVLDNQTGDYVAMVPYKYPTTTAMGTGILNQIKSLYENNKLLVIGGLSTVLILLMGRKKIGR